MGQGRIPRPDGSQGGGRDFGTQVSGELAEKQRAESEESGGRSEVVATEDRRAARASRRVGQATKAVR